MLSEGNMKGFCGFIRVVFLFVYLVSCLGAVRCTSIYLLFFERVGTRLLSSKSQVQRRPISSGI